MDIFDRIMELSREGYFCAQILAILISETLGETNPGLVRAMGGLNGGVGFSGGCCGCMTGGACIISYLTGKGGEGEDEHCGHMEAMEEFTKWFRREMTLERGGVDCWDIIDGDPSNRVERCPQIIADTFMKCMEILSEKELV